jgi:long-chain acyl-CoA synthetase
VGKNDRVCWYAPKSAHWLSAMTATWMRGAIFVPLHANNYALNQYIIRTTKPKIELSDYMVDGVFSNLQPMDHPEEVALDDPSMILFTSGSTSQPKGVVLSHKNILRNLQQIQHRVKDDVYYQDSAYSILPWHHCYGLVCELLYLAMNGAHISIPSSDNPKKIIQEMKWNYPTLFYSVPKVLETLYKNDLNIGSMLKRNLLFGHRIRRISVGGAICHPHLLSFMTESYNIPILQGYGMTETSPMISLNSIFQNRLGSVGKPLEKIKVQIDPEDNEIYVSGDNVMSGYLRFITKQNELLLEDQGEWFHTGDKGYFDSKGYLHLYGRTKTEYKLSNGKYVNPVFLEKLLGMSSQIDQAIIFGEGRKHNQVILYSENRDKEKLLNYIQQYLEDKVQPYEIPRDIIFADEPFTTNNGMLTQKLEPNRHKIMAKYGST